MITQRFLILIGCTLLPAFAWAGDQQAYPSPNPEVGGSYGFRSVSNVGDLDEDGFSDLVAGAFRADVNGISDAGAAYIVSSRTGGLIHRLVSPTPEFEGWFGHSVLGFDDITGDGVPEILVGASTESGGASRGGRVYIFNGATGALVRGLNSPNPLNLGQFGITLAAVPDVNGDGVAELAVGAFGELGGRQALGGRVYIFDIVQNLLLNTLESPAPEFNQRFGHMLLGIPDLTGDGAGEVLVGAPGDVIGGGSTVGHAFVMNPVTGAEVFGLESQTPIIGGRFGATGALIPDLTGDGTGEIAIGAHEETVDGVAKAGSVQLFDGDTGTFIRSFTSQLPREEGLFGIGLAGQPDLNGNGFAEILIGAYLEPAACAANGGVAYLVDAQTGDLLRQFESPTPVELGIFGQTITTLPDSNGDGLPEAAIAEPGGTVGATDFAGQVHVFFSPLLDPTDGGQTLDDCRQNCGTAPGPDGDGDGLGACIETCLGSSNTDVDSDDDGMPDGFEAEFGLDPLLDDRAGDPDRDGVLNLDEFLQRASPVSALEPAPTFFVRPNGVDRPDAGSYSIPWQSITFALSQVTGTQANPVRIVVVCGTYEEDIALEPFTTLEGMPGASVSIEGTVLGAQSATLANVTVDAAGTLVQLEDTPMTFRTVRFINSAGGDARGLVAIGPGVSGTVIEDCVFTGLTVGLEIEAGTPVVRRNIFEQCAEAGVLLRASAGKKAFKELGDSDDPRTGWNTFRANPQFNLVNEDDEAVTVQLNDWDTDSAEAVANSIQGPASFEPFLPKGAGILAASIFCSVSDAQTQKSVENASVRLTPSGYPELTENTQGVYAFPAVSGGSYDVFVNANGYSQGRTRVDVGDGQVASVNLPLLKAAEEPRERCSLNGNSDGEQSAGNAAVGAVALLMVLASRNRYRK